VAAYSLSIKRSAAKELDALPTKADRARIVKRILGLAKEPRPPGCQKLAGHEDRFRLRQGDWRIVYAVDDDAHAVVIFKIGHRREVYR
jgi:mRNA interferase RelE/StbE